MRFLLTGSAIEHPLIKASGISDGAARAAYRIHRSLAKQGEAHGTSTQVRVISQLSDDPSVLRDMPVWQRPIWSRL